MNVSTENNIEIQFKVDSMNDRELLEIAALAAFNSFVEMKLKEERTRIESNSISLYEKTGDINDINALIIHRNVLRGKMESC